MIPFMILILNKDENFISDIQLSLSKDSGMTSGLLTLDLRFKIEGEKREVFDQKRIGREIMRSTKF